MLVYKCLHGLAPLYIPDRVLSTSVHSSRPSIAMVRYHGHSSGSMNTEVHWQTKFHSRRSNHMRQFKCWVTNFQSVLDCTISRDAFHHCGWLSCSARSIPTRRKLVTSATSVTTFYLEDVLLLADGRFTCVAVQHTKKRGRRAQFTD